MDRTKLKKKVERNSAMEKALTKQRNLPVTMHNTWSRGRRYNLSNAGKSMSLTEQKMLLFLISRIRPNDQTLEPQVVSLKYFCQVCGIGGKTPSDSYAHLKASIQHLADRSTWIRTPDGKDTLVRMISKVKIDASYKSTVEIHFDPDMQPFLLNLKKDFYSYPLIEVLRMKSKYGVALFEILKSYAFSERPLTVDIDTLQEQLDATCYRSSITNFKNKVITPALRDINTYSGLKVTEEYIKTGRAITQITFYITDLTASKSTKDQEELKRRYDVIEDEFVENEQISLFA